MHGFIECTYGKNSSLHLSNVLLISPHSIFTRFHSQHYAILLINNFHHCTVVVVVTIHVRYFVIDYNNTKESASLPKLS